jgi:Ca-activated chloride channel family protein
MTILCRALFTVAPYGLIFFLTGALLASCGRPTPIAIHIVYGSEKKEWLEPLIAAYNQSQSQVRVQGYPTGSVDPIHEILEEINTPTVWAPASSIYIPLVNEEWRQIYDTDLIQQTPRSLVLSPVIIAMWREKAEALGWPDQAIGWADISRLATAQQGWAAYGHPEWGVFKFGHTNPEYSYSGLVSILAIAYAAAGKQSTLTPTDLTNPQLRVFVEEVLTSVSHYGRSTGFFAESMFHCEQGGPSYLSAAILYENLVVVQEQKRLEGKGCEAKHPPVVAIYPAEGTFWTDHPYIILNAPWVTEEQRTAAREFEAFLLAEPQQRRAMAAGFRPADPNISYTSPLDSAHGVDPAQPSLMLQTPSTSMIRELLKLWAAS